MRPTPDLCDYYSELIQVLEQPLCSYGGRHSFGGEIVTVKCFEDNSLVKELVATDGQGKVMVVDGGGSTRRALLGDQLAAKAVENGWQGLIINGCIRDVDEIGAMQLGVKSLGAVPVKTEKRGIGVSQVNVRFGGVEFHPGEYVYADNNGVIVSPQALE